MDGPGHNRTLYICAFLWPRTDVASHHALGSDRAHPFLGLAITLAVVGATSAERLSHAMDAFRRMPFGFIAPSQIGFLGGG